MDVIDNIFSLMNEKRFQKQEFASALGVSASAVTSLLNRTRDVKVSELPKIAKILGVREIDLLTYPDVYELKTDNNMVLTEPVTIYEKTDPTYKHLRDLSRQINEVLFENERLKNAVAQMG